MPTRAQCCLSVKFLIVFVSCRETDAFNFIQFILKVSVRFHLCPTVAVLQRANVCVLFMSFFKEVIKYQRNPTIVYCQCSLSSWKESYSLEWNTVSIIPSCCPLDPSCLKGFVYDIHHFQVLYISCGNDQTKHPF